MGYESQDIITAGRNTFSIVLHENTKILNEIVVVGYGTQKKVNLTGAVQMVDSEILNDRPPLVNAAKGLQGAIPNLNISFKTGDPTSETKFNIRGATSLNGGSALVLVDGVETDLNLINPQDIESVSVLKDAASAAVYGPRGSFGVILVTTKRGKLNQKLQINYNNSFAWSSPSRLPKGMASDKWLESINQANINNGGEPISLLSKLKRLKSSLLTRLTTLLHSWIRLESSLAEDNGVMPVIPIGIKSFTMMLHLCSSITPVFPVARRRVPIMVRLAIKDRTAYSVLDRININALI